MVRLYAVLDAGLCERRGIDPLRLAEIWLDAGVRLIQLRAKALASGAFLALAEPIAERARGSGATFIVNDRADIARFVRADGVHLGQDDLSPGDVRRVLAPGAIVGLSTHNRSQVLAALAEQPGYVAIGPVFSTSSKANPDPVVGLEGVREAVDLAGETPVVAIGGITLERVPDVFRAGAASVAVISDLLADDPVGRVRAFLEVSGSQK